MPPIPTPIPTRPPIPGIPPTGVTEGAKKVGAAAMAAGNAAPNAGTVGATGAPGIPPKAGKVGAAGTRPARLEAQKGPPMPVVAHRGPPIPVSVQAGTPVVAPARKLVTHGGICALQLMVSVPKTAIITKLINRAFKNPIFILLPLSSKLNNRINQFSNELCPFPLLFVTSFHEKFPLDRWIVYSLLHHLRIHPKKFNIIKLV
jgi:hypothetical protein